MTAGQITFPLLNMTASVLANVVASDSLSPEHEIETVRHELDVLFTRYLDAYRKQTA